MIFSSFLGSPEDIFDSAGGECPQCKKISVELRALDFDQAWCPWEKTFGVEIFFGSHEMMKCEQKHVVAESIALVERQIWWV